MSAKQHYATLDGLRGLAAIVVVVLHIFQPFGLMVLMQQAYLAVDFFFLLSGFVIAYAYQNRLRTGLSVAGFVQIRLRRLYPLALVGLICSFMIFVVKHLSTHAAITSAAMYALVSGLLLCPSAWSLEHGWEGPFPYNPPAWSLFWEFAVNIVYAWIAPRLTRRALTAVVAISGIGLLARDYVLGSIVEGQAWATFYGYAARVTFPFFCGVLLYNLHASARRQVFHRAATPLMLGLVGTLLLPLSRFGPTLAVVVVFPAIVFVGALDEPSPRVGTLCLALGRISYPVYILHWPVLKVFANYFFSHNLTGLRLYVGFVLELLAAIAFAYCAMIFIDDPVRAFLNRRAGRSDRSVKPIGLVARAASR
jgi:peptidoglycan/LPS O-acetylase OafA/YrhL